MYTSENIARFGAAHNGKPKMLDKPPWVVYTVCISDATPRADPKTPPAMHGSAEARSAASGPIA